jgi:hypothetical protein
MWCVKYSSSIIINEFQNNYLAPLINIYYMLNDQSYVDKIINKSIF